MIRVATLDDIPRMLGLGAEFHALTGYRDLIPWDDNSFAQTLANLIARGWAWVYEVDGRIEGMAGAQLQPSYFNRAYLTCQELFVWVNPSVRGAGMQLFDMLESWAKDNAALVMVIASPPGLRDEVLDRKYKARGYVLTDHFYTKVL